MKVANQHNRTPASKPRALRSCVACRRQAPKSELLRVVSNPVQGIHFDPSGRSAGRGAYLCPARECFALARRQRRLERALRVSLNDSAYDGLNGEFSDLCGFGTEEELC